jgi:predicted RNA binding protein YcfA (HicA-like mRNA interferase family)
MPRLLSSKEIETILLKHGFVFVSTKGSHAKYRKAGSPTRTAIVPTNRREIPSGTIKSIIRQSNLQPEAFE